ncbi:hypothetical protein ABW20_dc0103659 [Dactylellina cionopaga]|nr:hypothetical protein ABW20_dc0103659 [Dactylellina cionopaga]
MNVIREVRALTRREIEEGVPDSASWHQDYRHTAYVFIGGLPFELSEGDIIAIFSQYGEPVHLHLARDRDTGKSRGFGWLKYEDQRSTNLAVDNLAGAVVLGRTIRVDHAEYKHKEGDGAEEAFKGLNIGKGKGDWRKGKANEDEEEERRSKRRRRDDSDEDNEDAGIDSEELAERSREDRELAKLERDHDDDDPMKEYLIREKKKEIQDARSEREKRSSRRKDKKSSSDHRPRRHHRSSRDHRDKSDDEKDSRRHRSHRSRRGQDRDDDDDKDDARDRRRHRDPDQGKDAKERDHHSSRRDRDRDASPKDDDKRRGRRDDEEGEKRRHRRDDDSDRGNAR